MASFQKFMEEEFPKKVHLTVNCAFLCLLMCSLSYR